MSSSAFLRALLGNLRAGFRLLTVRSVAATEFTVSFDQLVALLVLDLLLIAGVDWVFADAETTFDAYGLFVWAYYLLGGLWACALIARLHGAYANPRALLVTWLASVPALIIALGLILLLPFARTRAVFIFAAVAGVLIAMSVRAARKVFGATSVATLVPIIATIVALPWALHTQLYLDPSLWVVTDTDDDANQAGLDADDAESILFEQADRIADVVGTTAPQRPGITDTWFVGFAGDGSQKVFRNEALFAERTFAKRFGTGRRSVELINNRRDRDTYPLATVSGLRYALQLIGERMDKDDDVLVLLLTSHGSREAGIAVRNGGLPLTDLQPEDLRSALDDSGIKWRVVIVSACYAGVFLEPLKNDSTLVITAADADHTSFGCADDRELTYFGEAFLRDALPKAASLEAAFAKARTLIAGREADEDLTPSNPQLFVGAGMRQKLTAPDSPVEDLPESSQPGPNITASLSIRIPTWN